MKILELRKKIIINSIASFCLLSVFCGCLFYNMYQRNKMQTQAKQISDATSQIQRQASELQSKVLDIKKYMAIWRELDNNKKDLSGIKMDNVNSLLSSLSTKYDIFSPQIKVNLPENLNSGIFNCSTIKVSFTTVSISFGALDDKRALSFIDDFTNSLPGYVVINNVEIKRDKSYNYDDLVAISSGKGSGNIKGSLIFYWYAFKDAEPSKEEPSLENPQEKTKKR
jgi:hypothetical protein